MIRQVVAPRSRHASGARRSGSRTDDAFSCDHDIRMRGNPAAIATVLRGADAGVRTNVVNQLQRQVGNASVQRLIEGSATDLPIQRWAVGLPAGTTDCMVVVNWMNGHSPYRATSGWAKTSARHSWSGPLVFSGEADSLTVSVSGPAVTMSKSVDMPTWAPTHPAMRTAWASMASGLRAHEAEHEAIADRWKATMLQRLQGLSLAVNSRREGQGAVQAEFDSWVAEHQAEQTSIDPYTAMLDCSAATETAADESTSGEAQAASGADDGTDAPA